MTQPKSYIDTFFDLLGNETRRHITYAIHGSEYIMHHKGIEAKCLKTADVAEIIGKDRSSTLYHLSKLEKGGIVRRISELEGGKAVLMWQITDRWVEFADQFNLTENIKAYLEDKYKSIYLGDQENLN